MDSVNQNGQSRGAMECYGMLSQLGVNGIGKLVMSCARALGGQFLAPLRSLAEEHSDLRGFSLQRKKTRSSSAQEFKFDPVVAEVGFPKLGSYLVGGLNPSEKYESQLG